MGLCAAAVTSPLKKKIIELCSYVDKGATELGAVNTIVHAPSGWNGTNTDINGVQGMFSSLQLPEDVVVWGGGGTRSVLKSILPGAHFFSARRGEEIWVEKPNEPVKPEVVVWALGRARLASTQKPPSSWRPKYVMDLNYSEDSPGLEYAQQVGAKYISGRSVFKAQALRQREYWSKMNLNMRTS